MLFYLERWHRVPTKCSPSITFSVAGQFGSFEMKIVPSCKISYIYTTWNWEHSRRKCLTCEYVLLYLKKQDKYYNKKKQKRETISSSSKELNMLQSLTKPNVFWRRRCKLSTPVFKWCSARDTHIGPVAFKTMFTLVKTDSCHQLKTSASFCQRYVEFWRNG